WRFGERGERRDIAFHAFAVDDGWPERGETNAARSDEALTFELRAPIGVDWLMRVVFGDVVICREPGLRPHRRAEHEPYTRPTRSLRKLAWRFRVDAHMERIRQRARRMRDAGEVYYMRHAVKQL